MKSSLLISRSLQQGAGFGLAGMLALIALLHVYWAAGGRWGLATALGGPDKPIPPTWAIALVVGLLVAAVLVTLGRIGLWGGWLPSWLFSLGCWVVAAALAFTAWLNLNSKTTWEKFCFAPLSALLALAAVVVVLGPSGEN